MWQLHVLPLLLWLGNYVDAFTHQPPEITKQPPAGEILFQVLEPNSFNNKPLLLQCEAFGEPEPRYRWTKNGKPFNWQMYDDRINAQPGRGTLVIIQPREEDTGQYQCFATNEHGTATSNTVFVRKVEFNSFEEEYAQGITVPEGNPVGLYCQPPDGWPKPVITWMKMNIITHSMHHINDSRITQDPDGNLWMSNVTHLDDSRAPNGDFLFYVCVATSPLILNKHNIIKSILLEVARAEAPNLNKYPVTAQYVSRRNEYAISGQSFEMFCIFGGTPLPQVIWKKNDTLIQWNDRIINRNYGKSIAFDPIQSIDEGRYTCEASNGNGTTHHTINVAIYKLPTFTTEPQSVTATEKRDAIFYCAADGSPEPQIKWIFNGKSLAEIPANKRRIATKNSITIKNLIKSDTGNYGCNATNSVGYVYRDVYLIVLDAPPEEQSDTIEADTTADDCNATVINKSNQPIPVADQKPDVGDVLMSIDILKNEIRDGLSEIRLMYKSISDRLDNIESTIANKTCQLTKDEI